MSSLHLFSAFVNVHRIPHDKFLFSNRLFQVPQSTYTTPSVNARLEEAKSKNKKKAEV